MYVGFFEIQNWGDLLFIAFYICRDFFVRNLPAPACPSGRIPDLARKIPNYKVGLVPCTLEQTKQHERYRVAQMNFGTGRIYAKLNTELLATSETFAQFPFDNNLFALWTYKRKQLI